MYTQLPHAYTRYVYVHPKKMLSNCLFLNVRGVFWEKLRTRIFLRECKFFAQKYPFVKTSHQHEKCSNTQMFAQKNQSQQQQAANIRCLFFSLLNNKNKNLHDNPHRTTVWCTNIWNIIYLTKHKCKSQSRNTNNAQFYISKLTLMHHH